MADASNMCWVWPSQTCSLTTAQGCSTTAAAGGTVPLTQDGCLARIVQPQHKDACLLFTKVGHQPGHPYAHGAVAAAAALGTDYPPPLLYTGPALRAVASALKPASRHEAGFWLYAMAGSPVRCSTTGSWRCASGCLFLARGDLLLLYSKGWKVARGQWT